MINKDDNCDTDVIEILTKWRVCSVCCYRILKRNFDFVLIKDLFDTEIKNDWICYLCCGVLQTKCQIDEVVDNIVSEVEQSKFLFNNFEITVSTPVNLLVREHAIRLAINAIYPDLQDSPSLDDITTVKAVLKWRIKEYVASKLNKTYINGSEASSTRIEGFNQIDHDIISIAVNFHHEKCESECSILGELEPELFQKRRRGEKRFNWEVFTRRTVIKVLQRTTKETLSRYFKIPPNHTTNNATVTVSVNVSRPDPIIIGGRYCKYSRRLPQSPWIFDGVRKMEGSVEEFITDVLVKATQAESSGFVSSGREDVDVRMLGSGRPFVVELRNCKNMSVNLIVSELEQSINASTDGKLLINNLSTVSKSSVNLIKKGEEEKAKHYRAVIYCEKGLSEDNKELSIINSTENLNILQWTPIRVLHRRSLLERPRTFYKLSALRLDNFLTEDAMLKDKSLTDYSQFLEKYDKNHLFILNIRCQAGSYIKEFVHGDLGRTKPNLGHLIGQGCDILALDVMEIELAWPPKKL